MFVMQAFVTDKRGADTAQVKKALKKTIKKYYTIVVFDRDEYKSTMSSMIDQMLMVLYALLALSIIIAIFGIVNTLALSVSERTKEIGLLRAIGTSRGQVRGMLGIEAAIISVFGTVLGLVVGVGSGDSCGLRVRRFGDAGDSVVAAARVPAAVDCGRSGVQHLPRLPRVEAAGP